jgi:type IV pilus assembly protein PilX
MKHRVLKDERGMVWVIALLMLLVLTLLGISSVSSSIFETNVSGNDRFGADAFYAAEAGVHVGLDQIPSTDPIARTQVGEESYFWSGGPNDKSSPKGLQSFGLHQKSGYDASWAFKRYQINASGESFGAAREVEVQASMGPFSAGTEYNN